MGNQSSARDILGSEFKVYNVDTDLFKHSKGIMKITADEMIFTQVNCNPVVWPLNGIRRYGCHGELFMFECGRRCPTGEGSPAAGSRNAR